ncbi:MAG TPA: hypothetical protein VN253_03350, partial [Kofleriaceae bacterium]|nr:hypothetical protein [Kofleriaceae bacterium]
PRQSMFVTSKGKIAPEVAESETSVTAQMPMASLQPPSDELEARLSALISVLAAKGLVTEAELAEALATLKSPAGE